MKFSLLLLFTLFIVSCNNTYNHECGGDILPYENQEDIMKILRKDSLSTKELFSLSSSKKTLDKLFHNNDRDIIMLLKEKKFVLYDDSSMMLCFYWDSLQIEQFIKDTILLKHHIGCNYPSYNTLHQNSSFIGNKVSNLGTEILDILFIIRGIGPLGNYSNHVIKNNDTFINIYNGNAKMEDYFSN